MSMHATIVVLNWNNAADTLACLESLATLAYPAYEVLVVDNGSTDDSVARIRAGFPNAPILETGANLGYAGGNNAGIRHALAAGAEAIGILNNDVTVEPGFLGPLVTALQSGPDVGIVTPLVADQNEGDRVWALGSSVNRRTAEVRRLHAGENVTSWRHRAPFPVESASGTAMLVQRGVFERAGLMDESFFLYYEESDWCLNVRHAGYEILAVPSSVVWHRVSATLGMMSPAIDYYMLRNHLHLINRHWSGVRRRYLLVRTVLRDLATVAAYTVNSHNGVRIPHRNARLFALRDAALGRWGRMGRDVAKACCTELRAK